MAVLQYGTDRSVQLDFAEGVSPVEYHAPRGEPLADVAAAVTEALAAPLDYPALTRSTTPGDRIVLALDRDVAQVAQITESVIRALLKAGVDPDGISVLRPQANSPSPSDDPCRLLEESLRERIGVYTHDAGNREVLAYLAASDSGEPILLHRAIHDADLVLPIGCLHDDAAAGYYGIHTSIFPTFSDERTQRRFRSLGSLDANGDTKARLIREVDQVAWLLGINFTIQLVPAAGNGVLHALAGQSETVRRHGRQLYREAWSCPTPQPASLVVAAIEGAASQQTWESFGRALQSAAALVEDGGSIAICCRLTDEFGPAMQRMASARSREAALHRIGKERPRDTLPAAQLARTLDRAKVYLLSGLDPSLVEEMDMIPMAADEELARLVRRHKSCTLLSNAPHAMIIPP